MSPFVNKKARENDLVTMVRMSNRHFELKMNERMIQLESKRHKSSTKSYTTLEFNWRTDFKDLMKEKRDRQL